MTFQRFRVATTATATRRQVWVHVYEDRQEMARAHTTARDMPYDPDNDIHGGVVCQQGFHWPSPQPGPVIVMRLWTGQLTTRTIAHEATHAATILFFMDYIRGWDSRARPYLMGDNEPLAYAIGDISADVIAHLYRLGLITR
ncbi:hypothetical protein ASF48_05015 [Rathayibacter sp. Leaf299]|uniref:hypothetical protein n=1 Tax=Rathayibacter sp. Leaf299 TaxID=1736328 RepID=UPI0006F78866|nr:hypothetical protein [Rathayibacter sp. Leaf299]KQQ22547.1 hypothetical protein ASF48_05015 [Rathayibacter sp. Leaf299]